MKTAHQNAPSPQSGPEVANKDFVEQTIANTPSVVSVFVFQPGGTAIDNVYTSFALLYADLNSMKGQRVLEFDGSFSACTIPSGSYSMDDVEWAGKVSGFGAVQVTIANGVTLTGARRFRSIKIINAPGASTPFADYSSGPRKSIQASQSVFQCGVGANPLFLISGTGDVVFDLHESSILNATSTDYPIQISGTGTVKFSLNEQAVIDSRTIISAIGTIVQAVIYSSSAAFSEVQPNNLSSSFSLLNSTFNRQFPTAVYTIANSPVAAKLQELVRVNANSAGAFIVNLPSIGTLKLSRGQGIVVKETSGALVGSISLVPSGAETIDGLASFPFAVGGQSVAIVSDGVSNWSVVSGGSSLSGTIVSHPISGADRATYGSTTPRVVGSFSFNPSDYIVKGALPSLSFRALAANGVSSLTNSVQLYNLTDAIAVATLNFTNTTTVKQAVSLVIGGGAGQVPNSEKVYEVRIYLGANPLGDPLKTIELYSAHLVATSTL
jgi:hypothetical protein